METHVEEIKNRLREPLMVVVEHLLQGDEHEAAAFFADLAVQLNSATSEEDLIGFNFQLSTCAFQGFGYSDLSAVLIDQLLERAEQIANMMTAEPGSAH